MPIINRISAFHDERTAWRRDLHAHPETAFEEHRTADQVATKLAEFGIEVHRGLAGTGVVGTLRAGQGRRAIGLRADMDALHIHEKNGFDHASKNVGRMHACGHDGHTTMLLGAAKYLAETRNFSGTVHFIYKPGEEGYAGGRKMIEEGLFERFPCDEVYGLHNWPLLPAGKVAVRPGPIMAAADQFDLEIVGRGGHGAMPHLSVDPIAVGAQIVTAWQNLVSRFTSPIESAVLSVTKFIAGTAYNVIPERALLGGTVRTFNAKVQDRIEAGMGEVARGVAAGFGATANFHYRRGYPATINHERESALAADAAAAVLGPDNVIHDAQATMGAEDFSYMLNKRPGAYLWLGQGGGASMAMVHNPQYDFTDEVLPVGASWFSTLFEQRLPRQP